MGSTAQVDRLGEIPKKFPGDHDGVHFTKILHHDTYPAISPIKANLTGRTVLITGGSRGIGRALAVSFTQARVSGICIVARGDLSKTEGAIAEAAKAANLPAPKVVTLTVDVTDTASVESAAKVFTNQFPDGLDILVSNAGYLEAGAPICDSNPTEWWKSWEINLKGTYLVSRFFVPLALSKTNGLKVICTMSSIGAHKFLPGLSAYDLAKLAVVRFTEYLQFEYEDQGIVAFSFHPGGVATDMGLSLPEYLHSALTDTPELAADTVVWLTKERREWVKGIYVSTQWDMEELEKKKEEIVREELLRVRLLD